MCIYQCLKCYEKWTSRSAPGYMSYETQQYVAHWKFCPCCGTQWDGGRFTRPDRDESRQLGPRRTKIAEAIERLSFEQRYDRRREPAYYWVIEERIHFLFLGPMKPDKPWDVAFALDGEKVSAARALKELRDHDKYQRDQQHHGFDMEGDEFIKEHVVETRIRKVKTLDYPANNRIRTLYR